tara:strand:+ start:191 stop:493 length:303 start_codon:yes stop_codon:yes gene_type:complete
MADFISAITPNQDLTVADFDGGHGPGEASTNFATGDLRRKYNFGDRVSEVAIAQDPFFRFLSKVAKKPVDDPQFKWVKNAHPSTNVMHTLLRFLMITQHG